MNIEEFFGQLDEYFQKNELEQVEPYLVRNLEEAKEAEDYASYIAVGNEMIGFYRSVSEFRKAFDIAEDVLLLMEELQLGERAFRYHFAEYGHRLPRGWQCRTGIPVLPPGVADL